MITEVHGFDFAPVHIGADGKPEQPQEFADLTAQVTGAPASDVIFLAHGFRDDEIDATALYTDFLRSLREQFSRPEFEALGQRRFTIAAVYWPSKKYSEGAAVQNGPAQSAAGDLAVRLQLKARLGEIERTEVPPEKKKNIDEAILLLDSIETSRAVQDRFADLILSSIDAATIDATEGLGTIRARPGSDLLQLLRFPVILPTSGQDEYEGGTLAIGSVFGTILGAVGRLLNMTTWYTMKNRAAIVGANGVGDAVRMLKTLSPAPKVHLIGHSLGGRVMAACAKSLIVSNVKPDSLILLEAAFSHFGFSPQGAGRPVGFFRGVVEQHVVRGPLISTFSAKDTVVGQIYAIASRVAHDNVTAIGDASDPYGGIGRNGAQQCQEAVTEPLHPAGRPYHFEPDKVTCLDGSLNLINNHSDITNVNVTYAVASALAFTW